jgi:hypothetical protein
MAAVNSMSSGFEKGDCEKASNDKLSHKMIPINDLA